jgi:hypothetical protein
MAPSYRERLRAEGLALAACGAIGSVALIGFVPESRRWPLNTVGQLAVVAVLLEMFGTRKVRRWIAEAHELEPGEEGSGEPTPLWMLPPIMISLAAFFVLIPETGLPGSDAAGWDAGLRITGGCAVVGLAQALRFGSLVDAEERSTGRRFLRVKGSKLLGGTKLGYLEAR